MNAYEWGLAHESCDEALKCRQAYDSQADWYRNCARGDWLVWQLEKLPPDKFAAIESVLQQVLQAITKRALRRGLRALKGFRSQDASRCRRWAVCQLRGERAGEQDFNTRGLPYVLVYATAAVTQRHTRWWTAQWAAEAADDGRDGRDDERRRQAREIHWAIPEWPGESDNEQGVVVCEEER